MQYHAHWELAIDQAIQHVGIKPLHVVLEPGKGWHVQSKMPTTGSYFRIRQGQTITLIDSCDPLPIKHAPWPTKTETALERLRRLRPSVGGVFSR